MSKYTDGDANGAVSGYITLNSPDIRDKAKRALNLRFGDKFKLAETYKRKLKEWPVIKPKDGLAMQKFADFLQHCSAVLSSKAFLHVFDSPDENREMIKKLPRHIADRWNHVVDSLLFDYNNIIVIC